MKNYADRGGCYLGGGGGTPLYKLYRYVPPHLVGFLCRFGLKMGIHFAHFGLELSNSKIVFPCLIIIKRWVDFWCTLDPPFFLYRLICFLIYSIKVLTKLLRNYAACERYLFN